MANTPSKFSSKRVATALGVIGLLSVAAWTLWEPGQRITDGRHDLGRNGIWLQHGWLGDADWFSRNGRSEQMTRFRSPENISALAALL